MLDVGCGDARYGDVFAPLATSGLVRYHGVEPDAASAGRARERWPWAGIVEAPVEQFAVDGARYDHILVLRSYNHLRDPRAELARLTQALRPDGTLIVADNVAFGLVRGDRQARRAEAGPARFEHYRNDGSDEAVRTLADLPLELVRRSDVTPATSNQWFLQYRRPSHPPGFGSV